MQRELAELRRLLGELSLRVETLERQVQGDSDEAYTVIGPDPPQANPSSGGAAASASSQSSDRTAASSPQDRAPEDIAAWIRRGLAGEYLGPSGGNDFRVRTGSTFWFEGLRERAI